MTEKKIIPKDDYTHIIEYRCGLYTAILNSNWSVVEIMLDDMSRFDISNPVECVTSCMEQRRPDIARRLVRDLPMDSSHIYKLSDRFPKSDISEVLEDRLKEKFREVFDRMNDIDPPQSSWCSIL